MSRTVSEFLKLASMTVTPAVEPAKVAAKKTIPPTTPVGGKKPANDPTEKNPQDTGATSSEQAQNTAPAKEASVNHLGVIIENGRAVGIDTSVYKTAKQQALARQGVFVVDAQSAEIVYDQNKQAAAQQKHAALEKLAQEERLRGRLMYQGMYQEAAALQAADGTMGMADLQKVAAQTGCNVSELVARAQELHKIASQLQAATSSPALVDGMLGSAAHTDSSEVMGAAERNGNTTDATNEAIAQTRGPVSGIDEKLLRFDTPVTLPGNPGLNNGQKVDQGKALGQ